MPSFLHDEYTVPGTYLRNVHVSIPCGSVVGLGCKGCIFLEKPRTSGAEREGTLVALVWFRSSEVCARAIKAPVLPVRTMCLGGRGPRSYAVPIISGNAFDLHSKSMFHDRSPACCLCHVRGTQYSGTQKEPSELATHPHTGRSPSSLTTPT